MQDLYRFFKEILMILSFKKNKIKHQKKTQRHFTNKRKRDAEKKNRKCAIGNLRLFTFEVALRGLTLYSHL